MVQKLGQDGQGCNDHIATFAVSLGSAMLVLVSASVLPLSWKIWKEDGQVPFVVAFCMFAFAGAMVGPPMNGVAVSAVPHASRVASALQFAMQMESGLLKTTHSFHYFLNRSDTTSSLLPAVYL